MAFWYIWDYNKPHSNHPEHPNNHILTCKIWMLFFRFTWDICYLHANNGPLSEDLSESVHVSLGHLHPPTNFLCDEWCSNGRHGYDQPIFSQISFENDDFLHMPYDCGATSTKVCCISADCDACKDSRSISKLIIQSVFALTFEIIQSYFHQKLLKLHGACLLDHD